jgi:RNA 3'-terminal phosphate cyclase
MALAKGESVIRTSALTSHTATQIWLVEQFLPVRFEVAGTVGEVATLRVQRVGWTRQN